MRLPVIFAGHGDPMIALQANELTANLARVGARVLEKYGRPRAILAISAHWYTHGLLIQNTAAPQQINDMFGFPKELYAVRYRAKGFPALAERVGEILGGRVEVDNDWGIDHGVWTIFVHMFPAADIPVVELSVDGDVPAAELFEIGRKLSVLRDEGILIFGSGNIVHNLREIEWENPNGSAAAVRFNKAVIDAVKAGAVDKIINYEKIPDAAYAIPTPEHFLPLIYCLGAADGDSASVFNDACNMGSLAMTGFVFEKGGGLRAFIKNLIK